MKKIKQLPLDQRLRAMPGNTPIVLLAFGLYGEDYFKAMADLTDKPFFRTYYEQKIEPLHRGMKEALMLCQLVAKAKTLPKGNSLLTALLVTPFAMIEERRIKNEPNTRNHP